MPSEFICQDCKKPFTVAPAVLARYPGWTPRQCLDCRGGPPRRMAAPQAQLTPKETLARFDEGPNTGVFTDGFCEPNPGRGGWGAVKVIDGEIIEERRGGEDQTTNNRMELKALIEGYKMLHEDESLPVFSDSELCIKTITEWAAAWERNGWKRGKKREEIKNLDLVKELYGLAKSRPKAKPEWIKGHAGSRWNEYADALSRAHEREADYARPTR